MNINYTKILEPIMRLEEYSAGFDELMQREIDRQSRPLEQLTIAEVLVLIGNAKRAHERRRLIQSFEREFQK